MNTNTKTRTSAKELTQKITAHIEELAQATDAARMSETFQEYLAFCARFHHYSINNQWLIWISKPDATHVAGYCKWKEMGRYVRKGEKGIPILAPILIKTHELDDEDAKELVGFKVVYVFDISQTEGDPLPEPPNWKSPEQNALLTERLMKFAEKRGITVEIKQLAGETQGVSKGGRILLSPDAGVKTLVHEIAHELMHHAEKRLFDRTILELEAESVAYVVGQYFGLEGLNSPNYIALHGADSAMILEHLDRIRSTAAEIIKAIEE